MSTPAAGERRTLVTLDRGFGDVRSYPPGSHASIVVLHIADQSPQALADLVRRLVSEQDLDELAGCVVIPKAGQARVRRPPEPR